MTKIEMYHGSELGGHRSLAGKSRYLGANKLLMRMFTRNKVQSAEMTLKFL